MIIPKRHTSSFENATLEEIRSLASNLREILQKMYLEFSDPPYNYFIRSFAKDSNLAATTHWYLKIIFQLSIPGGYEASTAAFVNSVPPEDAAAHLRRIKTSKVSWRKEYKNLLTELKRTYQ